MQPRAPENCLLTQPVQSKIYHERQSKQLCALHTLNNLFQDPNAFSKHELDAICDELAPNSSILNPHRSVLGLGCYDVNVIITALAKRRYEVAWFDKRKDASCLNLNKIFGFILNEPNAPSQNLLAIPLNYLPSRAKVWSSQKHWTAVRKIDTSYYNLDSKLDYPSRIGQDEALLSYLNTKLASDDVEILVVVDKRIPDNQNWLIV